MTFEFEKKLIGSSIFHQKPVYQNNIIVPHFKFVFTWPTRCGQNHTQTEAQSHTTIYPSIDDRIKFKKKLYAERPTCMTPPPWPSLEWRKQSGSSSILASQSKTTISNSVHAGLEALKYPSHAISIKPSNKMYTISFSSFVLIEIFYARPLTETKWKGLYPRKSDTSNSVWENVGYDGWVGVSSGEVRVELWGMPVSYLQNPKIYSQHFKKEWLL